MHHSLIPTRWAAGASKALASTPHIVHVLLRAFLRLFPLPGISFSTFFLWGDILGSHSWIIQG